MARAKAKPSDNTRDFFRDLKRADALAPIYLVFGEETYLLELAWKAIRDKVLPGGLNDFNHDVFYGKDLDPQRVVAACETLAFMGGHRMVLVRDIQAVSTANLKPLADYLGDPSPSTTLVCYGLTTDKALVKTTSFYKTARAKGTVHEFKALREWEVGRYLQRLAANRKLVLEPPVVDSLVQAIGTDLASLDSALERIDLYMGPNPDQAPREVTEDVLGELIAATRSHEIFELTEAIAQQDLARSMRLLRAMLDQGQSGVGINLMIARQMRQIWQVRAALTQGMAKADVARAAGMSPFFVDRFRAYAKRFTPAQLQRAMAANLDADRLLKSSRLSDRVLLERLILTICDPETAQPPQPS